jgi:hypothetical protein
VEVDNSCLPRFGRLGHEGQLGDQLAASAIIPGNGDSSEFRMGAPQIVFGCFEELARVMNEPLPSGASQELDAVQDLRLERRAEAF